LDSDDFAEQEGVFSTPEFSEPSQSLTKEEEDLILNFDEETVTADYEAVD
jgi:hypothetical protein